MQHQSRNCQNIARALCSIFKTILLDESPIDFPERQRQISKRNLILKQDMDPIKYMLYVCKRALHRLKQKQRTMTNISIILFGQKKSFQKLLHYLNFQISETDFQYLPNCQILIRQFFCSKFSQKRQKIWQSYQNQKYEVDKIQFSNTKIFINQYIFYQKKLNWDQKTLRFSYKKYFRERELKISKKDSEVQPPTTMNQLTILIDSQPFSTNTSQNGWEQSLNIKSQPKIGQGCSMGFENEESVTSVQENFIQYDISLKDGKNWFQQPQFWSLEHMLSFY